MNAPHCDKIFHYEELKKTIQKSANGLCIERMTETFVLTLVDGSFGQYIPQKVAEMAGFKECMSPDAEDYHSEFTHVVEATLNEEIFALQEELVGEYKDLQLYFSFFEADGSYCLMAGFPDGYWETHSNSEGVQ